MPKKPKRRKRSLSDQLDHLKDKVQRKADRHARAKGAAVARHVAQAQLADSLTALFDQNICDYLEGIVPGSSDEIADRIVTLAECWVASPPDRSRTLLARLRIRLSDTQKLADMLFRSALASVKAAEPRAPIVVNIRAELEKIRQNLAKSSDPKRRFCAEFQCMTYFRELECARVRGVAKPVHVSVSSERSHIETSAQSSSTVEVDGANSLGQARSAPPEVAKTDNSKVYMNQLSDLALEIITILSFRSKEPALRRCLTAEKLTVEIKKYFQGITRTKKSIEAMLAQLTKPFNGDPKGLRILVNVKRRGYTILNLPADFVPLTKDYHRGDV